MNDADRRPDASSFPNDESRPTQSAGRRALLVAMPAILSLRSGAAAAHARSSNLLVVAEFVEKNQDVLCVKVPWGAQANPKGYDLGATPPTLEVTRIPSNRQFYRRHEKRGKYTYTEVTRQEMCSDGGDYYEYRSGKSYGYDDDLLDAPAGTGDEIGLSGSGSGWFGEDAGALGGSGGGDKQWKQVHLKRGAMCSATALASFANVYIKDI